MSKDNEFLEAFFAAHPQTKNGQLNLDELNVLLENFQIKVNNTPQSDFDGISPEQMHWLLYEPLSTKSLLQVNSSAGEMITKIPFYRLTELCCCRNYSKTARSN